MDFWGWFVVGLVAIAAAGVAGYFVLRWLFIRASERVTRHLAEGLEQLTRVVVSTKAGQATATATRVAAQRLTRLAAFAAAEHISEDAARREFSQSIERIARIMDSAVKLPLIGPVGLDAVLGLFPFIGDATSAAVSVSIIAKSLKYGVPREIITRMLVNVLFDLMLGAIPVAGDVVDMWYRANTRNVELLRAYQNEDISGAGGAGKRT